MTDKDDERLRVRPSGLDGIGAATAPCIRAAAGDGVTHKTGEWSRTRRGESRHLSTTAPDRRRLGLLPCTIPSEELSIGWIRTSRRSR